MVIHKSVSVKSIHFIRERDPNSLKQTNKIISLIDYREKHEFEKEIGNRSIHRNGKNFVCKKKRLKKITDPKNIGNPRKFVQVSFDPHRTRLVSYSRVV